jgi:Bcr/CflA subfamily drug resistance transporter
MTSEDRKISDVFRALSKRDITVIIFSVILGFIGASATDIYLPSMPSIATAFQATKTQVQHTIPIFLIGNVISQLIYGVLADRFGRRNIVLSGLFIAVIGFLLAILATNIESLLLARLIQGLGIGVAFLMFRSLICDVVSGKRLAVILSYGTILFSISPIVAPIAGGYIEHFLNWRFSFLLLLIIYLAYIIIFWRFCPETLEHKIDVKIQSLLSHYYQLLTNKKFLSSTIIAGVGCSIIMSYATAASFIFQKHFHLSPIAFGWLGIFIGSINIIAKQFNAKFALHCRISKLLLLGNLMIIAAGIAMFLLKDNQNFLSTLIPILIAVAGLAFIMGNAMTVAMFAFQHIRGIAASIYGVMQIFISFIACAVIAHFAAYNVLTLSLAYIILSVIGIVFSLLLISY